jgi:hypothetical protein
MTTTARGTNGPEELRQAICDGRIRVDHAIRAIAEALACQTPAPPSTQLVLDRLAVLQSTIETKLAAVCPVDRRTVEARSPMLLSFLQNWHLIAFVALITSAETTCLAYLLAR